MRTRVFDDNLVELVNDCSSQYINIQRGLKKSDPLNNFFFLLVVDGLNGFTSKNVDIDLFLDLEWDHLIWFCLNFGMQMILLS